ncbi:MAG: hypothetical protein CL928_19250 [Deltaproteobacteria bacterium]|nr:hypothetical protein [Deltaproteobacteria bacterium]
MNGNLVQQISFTWDPLLPDLLWVPSALVAMAILALSLRASVGLPAWKRGLLVGLRALAFALLAVILAGPSTLRTEGREVRDPYVVLIDGSRSMAVEDQEGTRSGAVARWLARHEGSFRTLAEEYDLRFFVAGDELAPLALDQAIPRDALSGSIPTNGQGTDLGAALFGLSDALGGTRPASVLLVSDGADRAALGRAFSDSGAEGVEQLSAGLKFPVSTWMVGDEDGPRDLAITNLTVPPFGFVRRPLSLQLEVTSRGLPQRTHVATLRSNGEVVATTELHFDEDGRSAVDFEVKPDEMGFHTYDVSIPTPEGDAIPANNQAEVTVKVIRDRTRILQVTSRPSWDVKFLRRLLKTDPNIDLVSFFILRNSERGGQLARMGNLSLIAFPYEELFTQDLEGFDLVIFQNFWFGSFTHYPDTEFVRNIRDYVSRGGAFLMIGGDNSFGEANYGSSPLAEVMPTQIPDAASITQPFRAVLSEAGQRHPVTRLVREGDRNLGRWEDLPLLHGWNPLGAPQEGGVVLATAGAGGPPIAAVRTAGKGRTMAFATDTTWRWAMAGTEGPGAGQDHALFWRNAIRWLIKDAEEKQVQLVLDRENYQLGDPMQVMVRVLREDYSPWANAQVVGRVALLGGGDATPIEGVTDADGQLTVLLPSTAQGTVVVEVDVPDVPAPFGHAEARASISDRQGEFLDARVRPGLLKALSEATGGKVLGGRDPDPRLAATGGGNSVLAVDRKVESLWNRWWLLVVLVLPLGAEWATRRRMGLP